VSGCWSISARVVSSLARPTSAVGGAGKDVRVEIVAAGAPSGLPEPAARRLRSNPAAARMPAARSSLVAAGASVMALDIRRSTYASYVPSSRRFASRWA
jgi:hypothetical protein